MQETRFYYEEQGWKYICTAYFFHVYQATRADATEIHTDPTTQGETFVYSNKHLKFEFEYMIVLYLISLGVVLYIMLNNDPVYYSVEFESDFSPITLILLFILTIWQTFRNYRKMKKLKQQLKSGVRIVHNDGYKPLYRQYFSLGIPWVILFFMFCSGHYSKSTYWEESLSTYNGKLPTISITALETSPDFSVEYDDNCVGENISYISHHWVELSPEAYHIEEEGNIERRMPEGNYRRYSPSLKTEYYHMRFQFLAKVLFQELLDKKTNKDYYEGIQYHTLLDTKFDQATLASVGGLQMLFARTDEKVIFLKYYGNADLETVVDEVYEAMNNFDAQ